MTTEHLQGDDEPPKLHLERAKDRESLIRKLSNKDNLDEFPTLANDLVHVSLDCGASSDVIRQLFHIAHDWLLSGSDEVNEETVIASLVRFKQLMLALYPVISSLFKEKRVVFPSKSSIMAAWFFVIYAALLEKGRDSQLYKQSEAIRKRCAEALVMSVSLTVQCREKSERKVELFMKNTLVLLSRKNSLFISNLFEEVIALGSDDLNTQLLLWSAVSSWSKSLAVMTEIQRQHTLQSIMKLVINTRQPLEQHLLDSMTSFFALHVTESVFNSTILPQMDKMLLRSPELSLRLFSQIIGSARVSLVHCLAPLVDPIISQCKSSQETIRSDALLLLRCIAMKTLDSDQATVRLFGEALNKGLTQGKVTGWEPRLVHLNAIAAFLRGPESAQIVLPWLLPLVTKETHEQILSVSYDSCLKCLVLSPSSQSMANSWISSWPAALGNDKQRSVLLQTLASHADSFFSSNDLIKILVAPLKQVLEKSNFNSSPTELIAVVQLLIRFNQLDASMISKDVWTGLFELKVPLLSDKFYSKFNRTELKAFSSLLSSICRQLSVICTAKQASALVPPLLFVSLVQSNGNIFINPEPMQQLMQFAPQVESLLIESVSLLLSSNASLSGRNAWRFLMAFTSPSLIEASSGFPSVESRLLRVMVLSHHPFIRESVTEASFIALANRLGLSSEDLFKAGDDSWIKEYLAPSLSSSSSLLRRAALDCIECIAKNAPELVIAPLTQFFCSHVSVDQLASVTEQDTRIWQCPPGVLCVDVLKKSGSAVEDKNRKGYKDEVWERQVREEIERKRGQAQQKLTKEEQAQVQTQLSKESEIRNRVQSLVDDAQNAMEVLKRLSTVPLFSVQLPSALKLLWSLLERVSWWREPVLDALTSFIHCLDDRIQSSSIALMITTLRLLSIYPESDSLNERFSSQKESVKEASLRLLTLLKQEPFSPPLPAPSFAWIHLFLDTILKDPILPLEQAEWILSLISQHCAVPDASLLPRSAMLLNLLAIIHRFVRLRKRAKEALVSLCNTIGDDATDTEAQVLLDGLVSSEASARHASLLGLDHLEYTEATAATFAARVWILRHDDDAVNSQTARVLWLASEMGHGPGYIRFLSPYLYHDEPAIRRSAGASIAEAMSLHSSSRKETLQALFSLYEQKNRPPVVQYDKYGMMIATEEPKDETPARIAIAQCLSDCLVHCTEWDENLLLFQFLVNESLDDADETVRSEMRSVGLKLFALRGKLWMTNWLPLLEGALQQYQSRDVLCESLIVLLGALAQHLESESPQLQPILKRLVETLKTPSEVVQEAVAACLVPLMAGLPVQEAELLVHNFIQATLNAPKYGERRGAAHGLAAVIKGRGLVLLYQCQVLVTLKTAVENKKVPEQRQGALFAFELLSQQLGRLFEPYIVGLLPLLLACFGDSNSDVRQATSDTARVLMGQLSAHCVKLVLPVLLQGIEDRQWRTKQGSVELLGSMAFLAPRQLSVNLPIIIPKLSEVLTDTHMNVQASAKQALLRFGSVIRNPEVQQLVPRLLQGLSDPTAHTQACLNALLQTHFVHVIDAPSLALIIPIVMRGMKERSTEIKRKAAQIIGNAASLTEKKDLIPYLPTLAPMIKEVLMDPAPEARAVAARTLGTLVETLGEQQFRDLIPELIATLRESQSSADRSGAAQGLSEVLAGLGLDRMERLLPDILMFAQEATQKATVRQGFMSLLVYLPATFGESFSPYLGQVTPTLLNGLADDDEQVHDTALKAGQMMVDHFMNSAVELLLPELEKRLFALASRLRLSAMQLLGDLLYRISGIRRTVRLNDDTVGDDEEDAGTEQGRKALLTCLGRERRDHVLSSIYILRADANVLVRQAAVNVWKSVVTNTPKTIKELLPCLMSRLLQLLSSSEETLRVLAANTLGAIVHKMGDQMVQEMVPLLAGNVVEEEAVDQGTITNRVGVCLAMSEILRHSLASHIQNYADFMIPFVRRALCDPDEQVRMAAAQTFDVMLSTVGTTRTIDQVLPYLLNQLQGKDADTNGYALAALREIMAVRSAVVFPVLIPSLVVLPMTGFHARALASLVGVAGGALQKRLSLILSPLLAALQQDSTPADEMRDIEEAVKVLFSALEGEESVHLLMLLLLEAIKSTESRKRRLAACFMLTQFALVSKQDFTAYVGDWLKQLLLVEDNVNDGDNSLLSNALQTLDAVMKSVKKEQSEKFIPNVQRLLSAQLEANAPLALFSLPKGIAPLLPMLLQGLMYGTPETREQSAMALGHLLMLCPHSEHLLPFSTQIAGPCIRILGDRAPLPVKTALLGTLIQMLQKIGQALKPFVPQLQRTFVKCLSEAMTSEAQEMRNKSVTALGALATWQPRVEALLTEILTAMKSSTNLTNADAATEAYLSALFVVLKCSHSAGVTLTDATRSTLESLFVASLNEESLKVSAAASLGVFMKWLPSERVQYWIQTWFEQSLKSPWTTRHSALVALLAVTVETPCELWPASHQWTALLLDNIKSDKLPLREVTVRLMGRLLSVEASQATSWMTALVQEALNQSLSSDLKRLALIALMRMAQHQFDACIVPQWPLILPNLLPLVKERNVTVRVTAERCLAALLKLSSGKEFLQQSLTVLDASTARALKETVGHLKVIKESLPTERNRLTDSASDLFAGVKRLLP